MDAASAHSSTVTPAPSPIDQHRNQVTVTAASGYGARAMADFLHITTARAARRIERSGIAARSHGRAGGRGVYCMPVLPSFTLTHQWVRELRRWNPGVLVAV